jgi:phosphate transport system protein
MPFKSGEETGEYPTPARRLQRDQESLWAELLELTADVESALVASLRALTEHRADLVAVVKERERSIDLSEVEIERECLRILALYDPTASDLRRLVTVLKVTDDLERMADVAVHLAVRARKLTRDHGPWPVPESIAAVSRDVLDLARVSFRALRAGDADEARALIADDRRIARQCHAIRRDLKASLNREPERAAFWFRIMSTTRNLERVAEHVENIAERVIYMKEGTLVRHAGDHRLSP